MVSGRGFLTQRRRDAEEQRLVATKNTKSTKVILELGLFYLPQRAQRAQRDSWSWGFAPDPKCELIVRD